MEIMKIDKKYNNQKISKYLLETTPIGYNSFCKLLRKKDIQINGKRISKDEDVKAGDEIKVFFKFVKEEVEICYEDDNILVVNKESGIEVEGEKSLTKTLLDKYTNIYASHRLDRNTKGLVVFAKNKEALELLEKQFKERKIKKYYKALIVGHVVEEEKTLRDYLFKDNKKALVYISSVMKSGYKEIITRYKVIEKYDNNTSLVEVELLTGRTHQIRAHMAYIGHPIVGDGKYGSNEVNKKYGKKQQELVSYKVKFDFEKESLLGYLNDKEIEIEYKF